MGSLQPNTLDGMLWYIYDVIDTYNHALLMPQHERNRAPANAHSQHSEYIHLIGYITQKQRMKM